MHGREAKQGGSRGAVYEGLTEAQREAVSIIDGPLLVLAAAGSGKTLTITRRIANMVASGIPPWSILALTFTNKAAGEMRARVQRMLPQDSGASGIILATFHSFCARCLRRYAAAAGVPDSFAIYDTADQKALIKSVLQSLDLNPQNFPPDQVLSRISKAKNDMLDPDDLRARATDFFERNAARAYAAYERGLEKAGAVDFDDLLVKTATLLKESAEVREALQRRFRYILIDEYQDTNRVQFLIAHTLAQKHRNICVVGDPDQSIYAWRGSDIRNILDFQKHYPDAQIVKLGENFRSRAPILRVADHLIKHNSQRKDKPLFTTREGGAKPVVCVCEDEYAEARAAVDFLRERHLRGEATWNEMAILYRTNALSRVLEAVLRDAAIPYTIVRGTAFFQRQEIRDALAFLRLIINPGDDTSLRRIINTPPRGIGKTTFEKVELAAIDRQQTLFEAIRAADSIAGLSDRAVSALTNFAGLIESWRSDLRRWSPLEHGGLGGFVGHVVRTSGLERHFRESKREEDEERLANLDELVTSAAEFQANNLEALLGGEDDEELPAVDTVEPAVEPIVEAPAEDAGRLFIEPAEPEADEGAAAGEGLAWLLAAYLDSVALIADADAVNSETGSVTLMTLHAAKGLEFTAVAIVGLEEGLLPHSRSRESKAEREEERRLFFVGITRAREYLHISGARSRAVRGARMPTVPSSFLNELPGEEIEAVGFDEGEARSSGREARIGRWMEGAGQAPVRTVGGEADEGHRARLGYGVGSLVRHPQFGTGRIESISVNAGQTRVRVAFATLGKKTLVAEFARLQPISG